MSGFAYLVIKLKFGTSGIFVVLKVCVNIKNYTSSRLWNISNMTVCFSPKMSKYSKKLIVKFSKITTKTFLNVNHISIRKQNYNK